MLKIRLSRVGKKKKPLYRVVVSENSKDMYGDHLEILGHYNPHTKETVVKNDRIEHWLKMGAQTSEVVANLFAKLGLIKLEQKAKAVKISKKRQTKISAKETAKKEAEEKAKADAKAAEEAKAAESTEVEKEEAAPEAETAEVTENKEEKIEEQAA